MPDKDKPLSSLPPETAAAAKALGVASSLSADRDAWRKAAGGVLPSDSAKLDGSSTIDDGATITEYSADKILQTNPVGGKPVVSGLMTLKSYQSKAPNEKPFYETNIYLDNPQSKIALLDKEIRVPHTFEFSNGAGHTELHHSHLSIHCPKNGACELDFRNVQGANGICVRNIDGGVGNILIGTNTANLRINDVGLGNPDPQKRLSLTIPASMLTYPESVNGAIISFADKDHEEINLFTKMLDGSENNTQMRIKHTTRNVDLVLTAKGKDGKEIRSVVPLKDEMGMIANDLSIYELKMEVSKAAKALVEQSGKATVQQPKIQR